MCGFIAEHDRAVVEDEKCEGGEEGEVGRETAEDEEGVGEGCYCD